MCSAMFRTSIQQVLNVAATAWIDLPVGALMLLVGQQ